MGNEDVGVESMMKGIVLRDGFGVRNSIFESMPARYRMTEKKEYIFLWREVRRINRVLLNKTRSTKQSRSERTLTSHQEGVGVRERTPSGELFVMSGGKRSIRK